MQSDPLGLIAGTNTYNYVGKNPMNNVDPLGLAEISVLLIKDYGTLTVNHVALLTGNTVHDIYPIETGEFASTLSNEFSSNGNSIRSLAYEKFLSNYGGQPNIYLRKYDIHVSDDEYNNIQNTISNLNKDSHKNQYSMFNNNCSKFVYNVLIESKIFNHINYSLTPSSFEIGINYSLDSSGRWLSDSEVSILSAIQNISRKH